MQILLFLLLFFAAISDAVETKIPNLLIIIGFVIAPVALIREHDIERLCSGIICAVSIFCILFFFFQMRLIGAGDIKLLMMMSLFLDVSMLLHILLFSFGNALPFYLIKEKFTEKTSPQKRGIRMSIPIFLGYGYWYLFQRF